jgi:CRP/FNR family transcriptional regulator, cyclic AMP receptor protein
MNLEKYNELIIFNGLCSADLNLLEPYFTPQTWVAGTVLFTQGDPADYLYLVVKGEVVLRYKPDDGPQMIMAHIQPGGVFGWSAAMNNPSYTSGACCVLDTEVLRIRGNDLRMICEQNSTLGNILLERLATIISRRKDIQKESISSMLENGMGHRKVKG